MANYIVGPFTVENPTPAELNDVRAVAARLPTAMRSAQGGLVNVDFGSRPSGVPTWAVGYNRRNNAFWVNPNESSSTRQYVIAHEFWHEWSRTNASHEQQARRLIVGNTGNTQTSSWTNDPDEGMAHGFAKALGFSAIKDYDFRAYIPASSYSHYINILGGSSNLPIPEGTLAAVDPEKQAVSTRLYKWLLNKAHGAASWQAFIDAAKQDDPEMGTYLEEVLTTLEITDLESKSTEANTWPIVSAYLASQSGIKDFGLFTGLFEGVGQFFAPIAHGFYFLVFIIIGLVILIVGVKTKAPQGATE